MLKDLCAILTDEELARILRASGGERLIPLAALVRRALCGDEAAAAAVNAAAKAGGCRCNMQTIQKAVQVGAPSGPLAQNVYVMGGQSGQVPSSTEPFVPADDWNCRKDTGDLSPCDLHKLVVDPYPVYSGAVAAILDTTGLPTAPAGFAWFEFTAIETIQASAVYCVQSFEIEDTIGNPVVPSRFALQAEQIVYKNGQIVHVWGDPVFTARTGWEILANRCACLNPPCVCVPAGGRMRFVFLSPSVPLPDLIELELFRDPNKLGSICGPCPPNEICGQLELARCECSTVDGAGG